jgi:hydroxymethylpyrimidine/phosphomethylpyrimidine kinase / thiaminase
VLKFRNFRRLLASKSCAYSDLGAAAETILAIVKEHKMHILFSATWGIDLAELESTQESPACTAYGSYIMDVGLQGAFGGPSLRLRVTRIHIHTGDAASLLMALAACLLGYGEVGLWLQREAGRPQSWVQIENNPYRRWIEGYSSEEYQAAVKVGIGACSVTKSG